MPGDTANETHLENIQISGVICMGAMSTSKVRHDEAGRLTNLANNEVVNSSCGHCDGRKEGVVCQAHDRGPLYMFLIMLCACPKPRPHGWSASRDYRSVGGRPHSAVESASRVCTESDARIGKEKERCGHSKKEAPSGRFDVDECTVLRA